MTAGLAVGAKLLAVGREALTARSFGRSNGLDAFFIALLLPTLVINLISGSFDLAFTPSFIQARRTQTPAQQAKLLGTVLAASAGVLLATAMVLCWLAPACLPWLGGAFGADKLILTRRLFYSLMPYMILGSLGLVFTAALNAEECFGLASASTAILPAAVIAALVLWARQLDVFALSLGLGLGALLQCLLLFVALWRRFHGLRVAWRGREPYLGQIGRQYLPMLAGAFLMCSAGIVDQAMAALLSSGSVSALNYGNRIITVITALTAVSLSQAILPYFSQMVAAGDWRGCRKTLRVYVRLVIAVAVPGTILLVVLSRPLVALVFERGAFGAGDTLIVTRVQQALAWQLPFYIGNMLYMRLISALRANRLLLWSAAVALPLDAGFNYIGMKLWGITGIAISTSAVYVVLFVLGGMFTSRLLGQRERAAAMAGVTASGAA